MRARPASGGYIGATSWIRFAAATREATRIRLVGSCVFASTGTLRVLANTSLSAPRETPPTTPPGTPPTTPLMGSSGGGGASCVLRTGLGMLMLVEAYAGAGARSLVTFEAAAGAGGTYNIVRSARLGSGSMK